MEEPSRVPTPVPASEAGVSIVLATLNERENLPPLIERIRSQPLSRYEIVVVDDGSTDGTREYLRAESRRDPRVRPIFHDGKQTTLRAQCQGIESTTFPRVVIMDADLQHPPELLGSMIARLDSGAQLVVASRYAPGGTAGPRTAYRWLLSRGAESLAKLLVPPVRSVSDPVSGYFAFRREVWVPLDPTYRGYKLLIFLLVMAEGRSVAEVPFRFAPRPEGESKVAHGVGFIRIFLGELRRARWLRASLAPHPKLSEAGSESDPKPL